MRISTRFTYEDLKLMPPDRNRYEIVDGDLLVSPSPDTLHQTIVLNLAAELRQHVRKHRLGRVFVAPYDVVFSSSTVLEPDVMFVSRSKLDAVGEKNFSGAPDLVVEVLSESTAAVDREVKAKQYARQEVPEFWLIDPQGRAAKVYRLVEGEYELIQHLQFGENLTSPLFPDLTLPLAVLWEP